MADARPLEETIPQLQALHERASERPCRADDCWFDDEWGSAGYKAATAVLEPLLALVEAARNHEKECCYHCNFDHFDLGEKIEAVARALSDALPEEGANNGG